MTINYAQWRAGLTVDVSRYQRRIRADVLRAVGVCMVIGKIGQMSIVYIQLLSKAIKIIMVSIKRPI